MKRTNLKRRSPRKKSTTRTCAHCARDFEATQEYSTFTRKYCTRACYHASQRARAGVHLVCAECGVAFEVKPSRAKRGQKYCSPACAKKNKRLTDEQYAANGERMHLTRRGKNNPRFKHGRDGNRAWRSRFNLELKGETCCRVCGSTHRLQLHHAIPRSMSRAARDEIRNGLPLCVVCHVKWHRRTLTIYRDIFTAEEWNYISTVHLTGQEIGPWLDERYPVRVPEEAAA